MNYSKRHYLAVGGFHSRDTATEAADRRRRSEAAQRAAADVTARFPILTSENAAQVIEYQRERLKFHGATT